MHKLEWSPELRVRLAKLIRMMSSDREAEVLASCLAIVRELKNNKSDIHDLADLVLASPSVNIDENQRWKRSDYVMRNELLVECMLCLQNRVRLNHGEAKFISSMEIKLRFEAQFVQEEVDAIHKISGRFSWPGPS